MIDTTIPGYGRLQLDYLVCDYNGTLAVDGRLIDGVGSRINALSRHLEVHVLTADTFGKAQAGLAGLACCLSILPQDLQDVGKLTYIQQLGAKRCVCMGNGRNDHLMLKEAALGVALILAEGACVETVVAADVLCTEITQALDLLLNPLRLTATLRS
jgi:P-type E1-E2 ATPase